MPQYNGINHFTISSSPTTAGILTATTPLWLSESGLRFPAWCGWWWNARHDAVCEAITCVNTAKAIMVRASRHGADASRHILPCGTFRYGKW